MNDEPTGGETQAGEMVAAPGPNLGVLQRITGMFGHPTETFRAIKARPTWLAAFLISWLFLVAFTLVYSSRIPYQIRRQADIERTLKLAHTVVTDEAQWKKMREDLQRQPIREETWREKLMPAVTNFFSLLLIVVIVATIYQIGMNVTGQRISFKQALAVRAYSDLPPTVTSTFVVMILMLLKSPDKINPSDSFSLLPSNLGIFVSPESHPVLGTIAKNVDIFQIWALILAVIGLSIVPDNGQRGSAIRIVGVIWLLGLSVKIGLNVFKSGFQ